MLVSQSLLVNDKRANNSEQKKKKITAKLDIFEQLDSPKDASILDDCLTIGAKYANQQTISLNVTRFHL